MTDDIQANDARTRRCPMLGHDVAFRYCRAPAAPLPCRRVLDCWWETFDVESFIRAHFTAEQMAAILAPPKPKMTTLVELIQKAKQSAARPPK